MSKLNSFKVRDHSVSKEVFYLKYDEKLNMFSTCPRPKSDDLSRYYLSENYISHTDASTSLTDRLYQIIKKFMFRYKFQLIKSYNLEGDLLDIGAGTGDFCVEANKRGYFANGIEPNSEARNRAAGKGLELSQDLTKISNKFDVITLWHVLEHVEDLSDYFIFLKNQLKRNGTIFIAVPNFKSKDAKIYKENWAAYDVPRHLHHFSQDSIRALSTKYKLQLVEIKPLIFDAFYVSILSEKYKQSGLPLVKGLFSGLRSNLSAMQTGEYSSLIYILRHKTL